MYCMLMLSFLLHYLLSAGRWINTLRTGNAFTRIITAIVTSFPEVLTIMPLEISKIALQLDSKNVFKNSMISAGKEIYKQQVGVV